jgi:hypothetical protein
VKIILHEKQFLCFSFFAAAFDEHENAKKKTKNLYGKICAL